MMNISRRNIAKSAIGFGLVGALAACSVGNGTVTVNLVTAQQEAVTIFTALTSEYNTVSSLLPTSVTSKASTVLTSLSSAVDIFTSIPNGSTSYTQAAEQVVSLAQQVVTLLSPVIGAPTVIAINTGLTILTALIAGSAMVSVPATVASAGIGATKVIPGPVPIPLS